MSSKRSKVWNYFTVEPITSNSKQTKVKCTKCSTILSNKDHSTSSMTKHLNTKHGITVRNEETEDKPETKKQKTSILDYTATGKKALEDIVSELAAVDGISIRAITRSKFIRESILTCGITLPKNESGVMMLVHNNFEKRKKETILLLQDKLKQNKRFSITLDEWTSIRMKRFININIHIDEKQKTFNLGLVRVIGSCSASNLVALVTDHLNSFGINFKTDIVSSTSDGCKMMIKYGRECPAIYQLCLNHGLQLGVCDTLYKKQILYDDANEDKEVSTASDSDEENFEDNIDVINGIDIEAIELEESLKLDENIKKVRKIVKFFKYSAVKNDFLQTKIKAGLGHELQMKLDIKTRWSSMADMVDNFLRVRMYVEDALRELNSSELLKNLDFELLNDLNTALKPIKLTVEALSREDATLISAELAINFMKKKLAEANTKISSELLNNVSKRIEERLNLNLMKLLKCLKDTNCIPSKDVLNLAGETMKRIFGEVIVRESEHSSSLSAQIQEASSETQTMSIENELDAILKTALNEPEEKSDFNKLKQEFTLFKNTGKRTNNLQKLYEALLTIKPTSTDAERAFSLSGSFCTKIRSRLSDKSLNSLLFLKAFYLNSNK